MGQQSVRPARQRSHSADDLGAHSPEATGHQPQRLASRHIWQLSYLRCHWYEVVDAVALSFHFIALHVSSTSLAENCHAYFCGRSIKKTIDNILVPTLVPHAEHLRIVDVKATWCHVLFLTG
jgi:hypothetical protein